PSAADNVVVSDAWPGGFAQVAITPSQGACSNPPSFQCALGTLVSEASATITATYTVPASPPAGPQTNTATVSSDTPDLAPTNNLATDTDDVQVIADLSV